MYFVIYIHVVLETNKMTYERISCIDSFLSTSYIIIPPLIANTDGGARKKADYA